MVVCEAVVRSCLRNLHTDLEKRFLWAGAGSNTVPCTSVSKHYKPPKQAHATTKANSPATGARLLVFARIVAVLIGLRWKAWTDQNGV